MSYKLTLSSMKEEIDRLTAELEEAKEQQARFVTCMMQTDANIALLQRAEAAEKKAEKYRKALEFYAQEENWFIRFGGNMMLTETGTSACDADNGKTARAALGE